MAATTPDEATTAPDTGQYRVDPGLSEILQVVFDRFLDDKVAAMRESIARGVLSGEGRQVAIALGWIGSRDSRVNLIRAEAAPARKPKPEPAREPVPEVDAS